MCGSGEMTACVYDFSWIRVLVFIQQTSLAPTPLCTQLENRMGASKGRIALLLLILGVFTPPPTPPPPMHVEAIELRSASSPRKGHRTKSHPSHPHLPLRAPAVSQNHKNKSSSSPLLRRPWKQGGRKSFTVAGQPPPTLISFQESPPLSQRIGISLPCDSKLCSAQAEKDKGCKWTVFCPNVTLPRSLSEVTGGDHVLPSALKMPLSCLPGGIGREKAAWRLTSSPC